jgi:hypothetical protein
VVDYKYGYEYKVRDGDGDGDGVGDGKGKLGSRFRGFEGSRPGRWDWIESKLNLFRS